MNIGEFLARRDALHAEVRRIHATMLAGPAKRDILGKMADKIDALNKTPTRAEHGNMAKRHLKQTTEKIKGVLTPHRREIINLKRCPATPPLTAPNLTKEWNRTPAFPVHP